MRIFNKKGLILVFIVFFTLVTSGCLDWASSPKETKSLEFDLIGGYHKVLAGDSTSYVVLLKNNREENDTVILSVEDKPTDWEVTLSKSLMNVTSKDSIGVIVLVNTSVSSDEGKHKINIQGESEIDEKKDDITITTQILEQSEDIVEEGDKVEVNYLGYLFNYKVFDTSYEDIGDDANIEKTPSFRTRQDYEPLNTFIGPTDLDPGDDYISTVEGFWRGCLGLKVGQSRTVILDPKEAYGEFKNTSINTTESIPMIESMTFDEFLANYPKEGNPMEGIVTKHHLWGWNISLEFVNETDDIVKILNEPYVSEIVTPYGWRSEVTYKNQSDDGGTGRILVEHHPELNMDAEYQNYQARVIDLDDEKIKIEYNISSHDLGDENLIFDITLVKIEEF